ncbi:MAG: hypothetical protein JW811_03265 [Clostridiales bacterium]|nr:hypothetical protein [Clostridiales bacterium]
MKLTDLKREHFPNGQAFSQKALDDYLAARELVRRDFLSRYVLSLAVGVAAGFVVLMLVPAGFLRIFLAMLSVMIAAMIGTRMTGKTLENLKQQAQKVNVTRKDMRAAKRNLKNGTVAWEAKQEKIAE